MPRFRKVPPEEAATWYGYYENAWAEHMFHDITHGDDEGIIRVARGWYVTVDDIHAEFLVSRYSTLLHALVAAVEGRRIIRIVVRHRD